MQPAAVVRLNSGWMSRENEISVAGSLSPQVSPGMNGQIPVRTRASGNSGPILGLYLASSMTWQAASPRSDTSHSLVSAVDELDGLRTSPPQKGPANPR